MTPKYLTNKVDVCFLRTKLNQRCLLTEYIDGLSAANGSERRIDAGFVGVKVLNRISL